MHRTYIEKIIASKNDNAMERLKEIMINVIDCIKKIDYEEYEDIEKDLYEICEGKVLTKEKAEKIIQSMKPYGMKWTFEESEAIRKEKGLSEFRPVDFWIVMNSAWNDQHELCDDLEKCIIYTKNFINDPDAVEYKVYEYFTVIPKNVHR